MKTLIGIAIGILISQTVTMITILVTGEDEEKVYTVSAGIWCPIFAGFNFLYRKICLWYTHHYLVGFKTVNQGKTSLDVRYISINKIKYLNLDENAPKHLILCYDCSTAKNFPHANEWYKGLYDTKNKPSLKEYLR